MTWQQRPVQYPDFQYEAWENQETAEVIVVERHSYAPRKGGAQCGTLLFGPDYPASADPNEMICEGTPSLQEALRSAREYMRDE